jgi:hypothetical protein
MTSSGDWNSSTSDTVVAYFSNAEDAQNVINELVDNGFPINDIGAAFHGASSTLATGISTSSPVRLCHDDLSTLGSVGSGAGESGAESDTSGVTPAGLSTGAGAGFAGASRPRPIPGSEIPAALPANIPSTLRSSTTAPIAENAETRSAFVSAQHVLHERRMDVHTSWWDKLKHLFSGESEAGASARREPVSDSGRNFGTGKGNLGISSEFDYPYSGAAFESSFVGMGIPQQDARRLAGEIRRGGAIVTVSAGLLNADADRILERNHGRIRYEDAFVDEGWELGSETARVQIFGRLQRVYPG